SLTTIAGLLAVWSAMSPRHRLLRLAVFFALPVALWLAPARELAKDVLLEMTTVALLILAVCFVPQAPYGRTYAKLPKLRFGLGAMFYATFLAALGVAVGSLVAPQFAGWAPEHVLRWLLDPVAISVAIAGAAYFAYGTGGRIKRLSALL